MLASFTANEAHSRSVIAREVRDRPVPALSAEGDAACLSLEPLSQGAAPSPFSDPRWLEFDWAGARLVLELPAAAIDCWLRGSLGGVAPATLSAAWRDAAVGRATRPLLEALNATGRGRARLVSHGESGTAALPPHAFALTLRYPGSGETVHARLHADGLGLLLAAGVTSALEPADTPDEPANLPVPMRLSIGSTRLPLGTLRKLARGDVVFITSRLAPEGQLLLHVRTPEGTLGLPVEASDTHLTVIEPARFFMSDTAYQPGSDTEFEWDQLPIQLSFDLGEKTLSLRELQRLRPGVVLPLERPLDKCVTIRANGAPIGSGELVDIDGRLGVSLVSLSAAAATAQAEAARQDEEDEEDGEDEEEDEDDEADETAPRREDDKSRKTKPARREADDADDADDSDDADDADDADADDWDDKEDED